MIEKLESNLKIIWVILILFIPTHSPQAASSANGDTSINFLGGLNLNFSKSNSNSTASTVSALGVMNLNIAHRLTGKKVELGVQYEETYRCVSASVDGFVNYYVREGITPTYFGVVLGEQVFGSSAIVAGLAGGNYLNFGLGLPFTMGSKIEYILTNSSLNVMTGFEFHI